MESLLLPGPRGVIYELFASYSASLNWVTQTLLQGFNTPLLLISF